MPAPIFELFEFIAEELSVIVSVIITHKDFVNDDKDSPLIDSLMKSLKAASAEDTIPCAVRKLHEHFEAKDAKLPFEYEPVTGRFTAVDSEFLSFVNDMKEIRTIGRQARVFERTVASRLSKRATGSIHRVGFPRDTKRTKAQFNKYLTTLGFERPALFGKEKDGGFDILWLLPVGTIPHRPIVSVQCKNGEYNKDEALISVVTASESLSQHSGLQHQVHVPCVLFNDYISPEMLGPKQMNFVPLGLTDLALPKQPVSVKCI